MPTAFACNSDLTASALYDLLRQRGYRIPEDISIVGYDNYLIHSFASSLTTYNVDMKRMASIALKLLLGKIRGVERGAVGTADSHSHGVALLIDCGANVDARASHLVQFARMGSIYMENVVGIKNPG